MRIAVVESARLRRLLALCLFVPAGALAWPMAWGVFASTDSFAAAGLLLLPADLLAERSRLPADSRPADILIAGMASAPAHSRDGHRLCVRSPLALVAARPGRGAGRVARTLRARLRGLDVGGVVEPVLLGRRARPARARPPRRLERTVCARAPPGYAGPVVAHLGLPVALGSLWGLVPALLGCTCLMVRIVFEERVLRAELPAIATTPNACRWRVVPRVW